LPGRNEGCEEWGKVTGMILLDPWGGGGVGCAGSLRGLHNSNSGRGRKSPDLSFLKREGSMASLILGKEVCARKERNLKRRSVRPGEVLGIARDAKGDCRPNHLRKN